MQRISATPFGRRPVTSGLLATLATAEAPAEHCADKWQVLHDLTAAHVQFGLSARTLTVLEALLSFHPRRELSGDAPIIVFPSNRALSERTRGLSEASLRRHLALLCAAGLLLRHDSPNGKRYSCRDRSGAVLAAYGFDLRPLLVRAPEIAAGAEAARDAAHATDHARHRAVLALRDLVKLTEAAEPAPAIAELIGEARLILRRKLDAAAFDALADRLSAALSPLLPAAGTLHSTAVSSGSDSQNERHQQSSDPDLPIPELKAITPAFDDVLAACPALSTFSPEKPRNWQELIRSARQISGWIGITAETWADATAHMGAEAAATSVACILQRSGDIRSPGAYLRHLSRTAAAPGFSTRPMVNALLRQRAPC